MKRIYTAVLPVLLLLLVSSCNITLEKRLYRTGFHVDRIRHNDPAINYERKAPATATATPDTVAVDEKTPAIPKSNGTETQEERKPSETKNHCVKETRPVTIEPAQAFPLFDDLPPENKKKNEIFSLLALILAGIALLIMFFLLMTAFLFAALAMFSGIIGLIRVKKHPDRYKNRWMAIAGICIGVLPALVFVVAIYRYATQ